MKEKLLLLSSWLLLSWIYIALAIYFIVATQNHSHSFYSTMRFLVCCALEWCIFFSIGPGIDFEHPVIDSTILAAEVIIILIFNTVIPLHLSKNIWIIIDIICACIMILIAIYKFICIFKEKPTKTK